MGWSGSRPGGPTGTAAERAQAEAGTWESVKAETPHFLITGATNLLARNPYVFVATLIGHAGFHLYESYAESRNGVGIHGSSQTGDSTFHQVVDWLGQPVVPGFPGMTRGDVVLEGGLTARRIWIARQKQVRGTCPAKNWRGKQCTLYRGHTKYATALASDHDYE